MAQLTPSFWTDILLSSLFLVAIRLLSRCITNKFNHRKLIQKMGCKAPAKYSLRDPFFGLDIAWDTVRAVKSKSYLDRTRRLHEEIGNTYSVCTLTSATIHTIEPQNIKTVLSTNFSDFGISSERKKAFFPLLGQSILLSNGARWEHSRALLRLSFTRSQVGDLAMLDPHVRNLIKRIVRIQRDGSTVDLKEFFFELATDVTSDFCLANRQKR